MTIAGTTDFYGIILINPGATLAVNLLHFTKGHILGAIYNIGGTVLVTNCIFDHNDGGITSNDSAVAIITNSIFHDNRATSGAAVVAGHNSIVRIFRSLFYHNHATAGGAFAIGSSDVIVANSTIADNSATANEVAFVIDGKLDIINSTLQNTIQGNRRGMLDGDVITLKNTIISDSSGTSLTENCGRPIIDGGHNLQYPDKTCFNISPVQDPKLGPLADNGGPTLTLALQTGSPAIGAGDKTVCLSSWAGGIDQRGILRNKSSSCDIGAFETGSVFIVQTPIPMLSLTLTPSLP